MIERYQLNMIGDVKTRVQKSTAFFSDSDCWVGSKIKFPTCPLQISLLIGTMVALSALWSTVWHLVGISWFNSLAIDWIHSNKLNDRFVPWLERLGSQGRFAKCHWSLISGWWLASYTTSKNLYLSFLSIKNIPHHSIDSIHSF